MTDATELDEAAVRARVSEYLATWAPYRGGRSLSTHAGKHLFLKDVRALPAALDEITRLRAALDEARAEADTHRESAESMTGLWEQEKDRASRLESMADRLADRRANHEPWHCCCAEGSHTGQAAALNRMKARAEAAESALAAVRALVPDECWVLRAPASGPVCTDMVGGGLPDGPKWTEDMCCLPCRIRAALATPTTTEETQP